MDRQDIDALLIGALYGELTPADEARLAAHLESHPGDRSALDDLKVARQKVHESRIFAVQAEPPQAISALLLQEAHRRAPKAAPVNSDEQRDGWFARFARNFMAHPAMAAAAMLVLVLGGAGIMYMKGDAKFANKEAASSRAQADQTVAPADLPAAAPAAATPPPGGTGDKLDESTAFGTTASGSAYEAQLYEGNNAGNADPETRAEAPRARTENESEAKLKQKSIAVGTVDRAPKDFAKNDTALSRDDRDGNLPARKAAPTPKRAKGGDAELELDDAPTNAISGAGADSGRGGYAQPPPPPPQAPAMKKSQAAPATVAPTPAPSSTVQQQPVRSKTAASAPQAGAAAPRTEPAPASPVQDKSAEAKPEAAKEEQSQSAWARSEHTRAVQLAKAGDCAAAAKVALAVYTRVPSYYTQNMATDRALKQCTPYINAERERAAEKARASKQPAKADTK
jgi:hypothetical protein